MRNVPHRDALRPPVPALAGSYGVGWHTARPPAAHFRASLRHRNSRRRRQALTADDLDWVPPGVDIRRANIARVYDYLLGGSHNFLADQDVGRAAASVEPEVRAIAWANRRFLGREIGRAHV